MKVQKQIWKILLIILIFNLKTIILTISNLKEYAKTLNLSLDEILEIYKNKEIKDETKN